MKTYIYIAFVLALYVLSFFLLWHNSAWQTTTFVLAIAFTLIGFWVEARGWEVLFEWWENRREP